MTAMLTPAEVALCEKLGDCANEYAAILARAAVRAHPDAFRALEDRYPDSGQPG